MNSFGTRQKKASASHPPSISGKSFHCLRGGYSMKQAADALPVRARTIAFHNDRIMSDMGLKTSADLLRLAIKEGLMQG
jgi:hypothetical protein